MPKDQMEIPGTERPKIAAIDNAAAAYVEARDKRMALTEKECAAKIKLIETMQKHADKLSRDSDDNLLYRYDDQLVTVGDVLTVKVKTLAASTEEE